MTFNFIRIAGYTGTKNGMNKRQKRLFVEYISEYNPTEFHHGDCIGGDLEAHDLVRQHIPDCRIIIHPPIYDSLRAFCEGATFIHPPKDYLARNKDIVIAATRMYATPFQNEEQLRSGTWSTWRFACKRLSPDNVQLILPFK
jgi:hypothetical protein